MTPQSPSSPRDEAERLVAALLGAASVAIQGAQASRLREGAGLATGGPDCCICPVCRVIAALRDPSPEFAERLMTGGGDLATGLTSILRAFGGVAGQGDGRAESGSDGSDGSGPAGAGPDGSGPAEFGPDGSGPAGAGPAADGGDR